jgi:hypothetical protein
VSDDKRRKAAETNAVRERLGLPEKPGKPLVRTVRLGEPFFDDVRRWVNSSTGHDARYERRVLAEIAELDSLKD